MMPLSSFGSLAIFRPSTLLVAPHLQYSDLQHCLSYSTCNIHTSNIACRTSLAIFTPPILLVAPHLQYSDLQHCLSLPTCNIHTSNIACQTPLAMFTPPTPPFSPYILVRPSLYFYCIIMVLIFARR